MILGIYAMDTRVIDEKVSMETASQGASETNFRNTSPTSVMLAKRCISDKTSGEAPMDLETHSKKLLPEKKK